MGGIITGLFGGSMKTPPYEQLGEANIRAGDYIDAAALENIDELSSFMGLSDETYTPWVEAGHAALDDIMGGVASGQFDPGEFRIPKMSELDADPGYQFRMSEGLKSIRRQGSAAGLSQSGAHTRAAMEYGQGLASEEYGKVYNRAVQRYGMEAQRRGQQFNRLASVRAVGAQLTPCSAIAYGERT